jgi:ABC-2 type transport system permease protein
MRNVWIVVKHEILTTISRKSFWFTTLLFPLMILAFSLFPSFFAQNAAQQAQSIVADPGAAVAAMGYVDAAGILAQLPPDMPADRMRRFSDEASAQAALDAGQIGQYYVIAADYLKTGNITAVMAQLAPISMEGQANLLRYVINYNLTGDAALARLLTNPTASVETHSLAPQVKTESTGPMGFILPFAVMFVLFFIITMTGGYMLQSVAKEKENRTAEVLLVSVRPRELVLGKVLGLGVVALGQMAVWLGGGLLLMGGGLAIANIAGGYALPVSFIFAAAIYFLLGYLLYASALGAVGALAPTAREGAQFTFIIILPLLVPFYLNQAFTSDPNGLLATILSLIPLTAPTAMMARLSVVAVPAWQVALSLTGLAVTTYLLVLLSARFFRADTLLSNASLNWGRLIREVRGRGTA